MADLTHFDDSGASRMVDVSAKDATVRTARASAAVKMQPKTLKVVRDKTAAKGDVKEVARLAGIMAAKRTSELIPLCHALQLSAVEIDFDFQGEDLLTIEASVKTTDRTGVEMEALLAASTAALTVYDMLKAIDRGMIIQTVQLEEKTGGRSGTFNRSKE